MRIIRELNGQWDFSAEAVEFPKSSGITAWTSIDVPSTWNKEDAVQVGQRIYRCYFEVPSPENHHYFLHFDGVGGACKPVLNGVVLGEHKGSYSSFAFEISSVICKGKNELIVWTDNTRYGDIIPLMGDFNNYGGILRPVYLIETGTTSFDPTFYGTCGLELDTDPDGTIYLNPHILGSTEGVIVYYELQDQENRLIATVKGTVDDVTILKINDPHLWNGLEDPFLYYVTATLIKEEKVLDNVRLSLGFRSIQIDPDQGFFLNGNYLKLHGVAKHHDRAEMGGSVPNAALLEDFKLIKEIGANSVRLSHYQHPQFTYDLCDQYGLVTWAEIPLLSAPDGNEAMIENARRQLEELIYQNKHHPSICFWGIQNEVALVHESEEMHQKIRNLDQVARALDPRRITASANPNNVKNESPLNDITQVTGHNRYYGWYYGELGEMGAEMDHFHETHPHMPLGITEYGVDAYEEYHTLSPKRRDYTEEFQSLYHEVTYQEIKERRFVWGSYIWNMFDFGSALRNEGGLSGLNRKGLVTFDRKLKKDAFYFYKACWSKEPFVYLTSRRFTSRPIGTTSIKVYTNIDSDVEIYVDELFFASQKGGSVVVFDNVPIHKGCNTIKATCASYSDIIVLTGVEEENTDHKYIDPNPGFHVKDWYTNKEGEDELFPKDRYTIMDTLGTLMLNPSTWAIVEEMAPQILENERLKGATWMELIRIINFISSQFTEDHIKELNRRLKQFSKT